MWCTALQGSEDSQCEALQQGRHPINCLATNQENILAVGDCGGHVFFHQVGNYVP